MVLSSIRLPISGTFFFSLHRAFRPKYLEKVSKKFLLISLCVGNESSNNGSTESYERLFVGFPYDEIGKNEILNSKMECLRLKICFAHLAHLTLSTFIT